MRIGGLRSRIGSKFKEMDMQKNENTAGGRPEDGLKNKPSVRRIKEAARHLRKLLAEQKSPTTLSADQSEEWAARLLGYASREEALAAEGPREGRRSARIEFGAELAKKGFFRKPRPIEINEHAALSHEVVLGSTGAGKTEVLTVRSLSLMQSVPEAGLLYVDGKGDPSLYARIWQHAASTGKAQALQTLNFIGAHRDRQYDQKMKISHSFNPLQGLDAEGEFFWLIETFGAHARNKGADRGARALFAAAAYAHAALKGDRGADPGVAGLAQWLSTRRLEKAYYGPREALPAEAWEKLDELHALAGSDWQSPALVCAENLSASMLQGWAENYPSIFATPKTESGIFMNSEIDIDGPLNGKILLVLLPALEKSPDEMALLGKAVLSSFRAALRRNPCKAGSLSALAILDELGYFAPDSYRALMNEATDAGVGCIFGGQDMPALCKHWPRKSPESEIDQAFADLSKAGIKTLMKSDDPSGLSRRFVEAALGSTAPSVLEMRDQRPGEAYLSMPGFCGRAKTRYVPLKNERVEFLKDLPLIPAEPPSWTPYDPK